MSGYITCFLRKSYEENLIFFIFQTLHSIEYGIFGEGSQVSTYQKREHCFIASDIWSLVEISGSFPKNTVLLFCRDLTKGHK